MKAESSSVHMSSISFAETLIVLEFPMNWFKLFLFFSCQIILSFSFFPLCPTILISKDAYHSHHCHHFGTHIPPLLMNPRVKLSVSEATKTRS